MEIKDNVRQRRQERIRSLTERHEARNSFRYPVYAALEAIQEDKEEEPRLPYPNNYGYITPEEPDPELLWKQGEKRRWLDTAMGTSGPYKESNKEYTRWKEWKEPPTTLQLQRKLVLCVILFAAVWGLFQWDHPLALKGQQMIDTALHQSMDTSKAAAWYEQTFAGTPVFLPLFNTEDKAPAVKADGKVQGALIAPVTGDIIQSFATTLKGIEIDAGALKEVVSIDTGRVIYASETKGQGWTVVVQHADGLQSYYSRLSEAFVTSNHWIETGEAIGKTAANEVDRKGTLYFAMKQNKSYVDPTEWISFD
ncbi:hypothetical protein SY83_13875 [Paenibacillus swuensis]|uniref:M23ase beta-sheet core domain-containing protein n=1 Tax=Paenibacillus swuensis TaxID=1178515 RepID=A0A172TJU0_9BACL|nr:M23 family metallopeptidase [Paenibacillus swuensis]ANE47174.1 hypothetical protein SY83_13875 [Paenibacillus swuensis]